MRALALLVVLAAGCTVDSTAPAMPQEMSRKLTLACIDVNGRPSFLFNLHNQITAVVCREYDEK